MPSILGWETLAPSSGAGLVTAVATLATAAGVFLGGLAVLLPAVRRLASKVDSVHTQVSENHHSTPNAPTLPDRLDDLGIDVKALTRVIDQHLKWSDEWTNRTERELAELHARQERMNNG